MRNKITSLFVLALTLGACLFTAPKASAQRGFDMFEVPRTVVIAPPASMVGFTAVNQTNDPVDIKMLDGMASLDVMVATNNGAAPGTLTLVVESSPDTTNWTTVSSAALISSTTTILYTNNFYGSTGLVGTNKFLLPGAWTVPTASTSGFSTGYFAPPAYTNSASIAITGSGNFKLGFNIGDQSRYVRTRWAPTGTSTNWSYCAQLNAVTRGSIR